MPTNGSPTAENENAKINSYDHLECAGINEITMLDLTPSKLKLIKKELLAKLFTKLQTYVRSRTPDLDPAHDESACDLPMNDKISPSVLDRPVNCLLCPQLLKQLEQQMERRINEAKSGHTAEMNAEKRSWELRAEVNDRTREYRELNYEHTKLQDENAALTLQVNEYKTSCKQKDISVDSMAALQLRNMDLPARVSQEAPSYSTVLKKPGDPLAIRTVRRPQETREADGIFLSRCEPNTNPKAIENFVKRHTGYQTTAIQQKTKFDWYGSFQIKCNSAEREELLNANFWPKGMLIRPFFAPNPQRKDSALAAIPSGWDGQAD